MQQLILWFDNNATTRTAIKVTISFVLTGTAKYKDISSVVVMMHF
jgi:hypothetical protein